MKQVRDAMIAALPFLLLFSASLAFAGEPCVEDHCVGVPVITIDESYRTGTIEAVEGGKLSVRFRGDDGVRTGFTTDQLAIAKEGYCLEDACVGPEKYFNLERKLRLSSIAGVYRSEGKVKLVLQFHSEDWKGSYGYGWSMSYLASAREDACGGALCVGDRAYNIERQSRKATIKGVYKRDGAFFYVLRYDSIEGLSTPADDPIPYYGGGWQEEHLSVFERGQAWHDREETKRLEKEGALDRAQYEALRRQGKNHREALLESSGPLWSSFERTENFLERLSGHLYQFDRNYLQQVKALLAPGANLERRQLFVTAAMLPYIRNLGYRSLRGPYLDRSAANMEQALREGYVQSLSDIEATALVRRMALHMLAASLQTALPQLTAAQKAAAAELLRILADLAAGKLRWRDMEPLFSALPRYRTLLLELSHNSYLQARVAVDMRLLDHLENN